MDNPHVAGYLNLDSRDDIEFALLDYPERYLSWAKKQLADPHLEKDSLRWIRVHWFLSQSEEDQTDQLLNELASSALKLGLYVEWAGFRITGIRQIEYSGDIEKALALYEPFLLDARKLGDSSTLALVLADYAACLMEYGRRFEAMSYIKEANEWLAKDERKSLHVFSVVKNAFAVALSYNDQNAAAIGVHLEMEKVYQERGVRQARASNLYNLALCYMADTDEKVIRKALSHLKMSLALSQEIKNLSKVAVASYGLGMYFDDVKQYREAVAMGQQALQLYTQLKMPNWINYSRLRLSSALIHAGDYQEALNVLAPVRKNLDPNDLERGEVLAELSYRAYRGLGLTEKALEHLEKHMAAFKKIANDKAKKEFNRASAQVGLQFQEERNQALLKEQALQAGKLAAEEERNTALGKQNQLQSDQIRLLQKFRVVSILALVLMLMVLAALLKVRRQSGEIQASRTKMKDVLDNIQEGIMVIDQKLHLSSGYSPYLEKIFDREGMDLTQCSLLHLLFPAEDEMQSSAVMIQEVLRSCFGETELSWELNHEHLPMEIKLGSKVLELHWQALYSKQKLIRNFLVAVRDVTSQRSIEQAVQEEKDHVRRLQQGLEEILAGDFAAIQHFINKVGSDLERIHAALFLIQRLPDAFREIHGWKGAARTLGLRQLATLLHHLESNFDISGGRLKHPQQALQQWERLLEAHMDFAKLLSQMTNQREHRPTDLYAYSSVYASEINRRLVTAGLKDQGLVIQDGVKLWRTESLASIHEILLHAITNAIDHGFILPLAKQSSIAPALIEIKAIKTIGEVIITVRDNGAGINWQKLAEKAKQLGRPAGVRELDAELLFEDGVSTAASATETSGRGVGLSAIKSICLSFKGTVQLQDAPGSGTLLTMRFPSEGLLAAQDGRTAAA